MMAVMSLMIVTIIWKLKVNWNSGVSYHFPAQVTLGTIAAS